MGTASPSPHGLLHMGVGLFGVLQIQSLSGTNAMHHEGQEVFRLLEQTFASLGAMLDKTTGEELETRLRKLLLIQEKVASHIVQNGQPRPEHLAAIWQAVMDLEAWAPIKSRAWPPGAPERFPFFAALAFARSSGSDAVLLQGSDNQKEEQALLQLRNEISAEAHALCNEQTLYSLAILRFPALIGYALLHRGLRGAGSVQATASGFPMLVYGDEEVSWETGIGELRRLLTTPSADLPRESLPLRTMSDYEWLISWARLERETFDVHSIREISSESLERWLGLPSGTQAIVSPKALRSVTNEHFTDKVAKEFKAEFGWISSITISPGEPFLLPSASKNPPPPYFSEFINSLKERFHGPFLDKILSVFDSDQIEFRTSDGGLHDQTFAGALCRHVHHVHQGRHDLRLHRQTFALQNKRSSFSGKAYQYLSLGVALRDGTGSASRRVQIGAQRSHQQDRV